MLASNLVQRTLESNQQHQNELTKHAQKLTAELDEIDKLLKAVDSDLSDDEPGKEIEVHEVVNPISIIPPNGFFNPESPFHEEAMRRNRYMKNTTMHAMKARELDALTEGVKAELLRLKALENRSSGLPMPSLKDIDLHSDVAQVNWSVVAERVNDVSTAKRTPEELRIKWLGDRRPGINHSEWKIEETEMLKLIVKRRQEEQKVDWVEIAKELGTNRTPIECFRRGIARSRHAWSAEGDRRLLEGIRLHGLENWGYVALHVSENATPSQCQMRYIRTLDPALKKGAWSSEEDERLQSAVSVLGPAWQEVALYVPGRTNEQCRERYTDSSMTEERNWTSGEDAELLDAVSKFGIKWKVISQHLKFASELECRTRYNKLKKKGKSASTTPVPSFQGTDIGLVGTTSFRLSEIPRMVPTTTSVPTAASKTKGRTNRKGKQTQTDASAIESMSLSATDTPSPAAETVRPRPKPRAKGKQTNQGDVRVIESNSPLPTSEAGPSNVLSGGFVETPPLAMEGIQPAEPEAMPDEDQPVTSQPLASNHESNPEPNRSAPASGDAMASTQDSTNAEGGAVASRPARVSTATSRRKRPAEEAPVSSQPARKKGRPRKSVVAGANTVSDIPTQETNVPQTTGEEAASGPSAPAPATLGGDPPAPERPEPENPPVRKRGQKAASGVNSTSPAAGTARRSGRLAAKKAA
ncbi:hypothetical protein VKT23_002316 [Stygiomarasmius scandens]|uniref:Uncharacterized protein n=1 Tax=Marasmiellus scandens TaxID=2682957 RepID=A0ABR1K589_9AGAR